MTEETMTAERLSELFDLPLWAARLALGRQDARLDLQERKRQLADVYGVDAQYMTDDERTNDDDGND